MVKGMVLTRLKLTLAALLLIFLTLSGCGGGNMGKSESKPQGSAPRSHPASDWSVSPEEQVPVKAVYLVEKKGGTLSTDDLEKHPDVRTVHSFADLERFAGKKAAVWIDEAALPLLQGDKEREWVIRRAQEEYTFAMIGYNDFLYSFREKLDCFGISGPGPIDWTEHELSPGFSVICQHRKQVGKELHVTGEVRGYKVVPTVESVLNVTNRLVAGEAAPETP
jgi:hypothetical protein